MYISSIDMSPSDSPYPICPIIKMQSMHSRIIDSVGLLELVAFLEEKFDIRVEDEEIIPENFDTINNLVIFVKSKLANNKA
jgi:hypothetical protein